ncbi:MAG: putative adhesin [Bacteroidota bacterium]
MLYRLLFLILLSFLTSCSKGNSDTLFTLLEPSQTGIDFKNEVKNGENMNIFKYRNFYNGGGAAIGDINNDGLADVFLLRISQ